MSKIEVDAIDKQSGSTLTLGGSGTAVTLAAGATQTGFGRSGSVNWQTGSLKTSTFTAADGEGYFVNSGSAITMNLPAGSAGAIVAVSDYARNFSTYNLTISANGSEKIGGVAQDAKLTVNGQAATFVYVDSTKGWVNVQNAEDTETGLLPYVTATGGTITTSGDFKIHTFTGPGTFCVSAAGTPGGSNTVDYLVVAGGGGGGYDAGGAGAGGGYRESSGAASGCYARSPLGACVSALSVTATAFPITVGAGGAQLCAGPGLGNPGSISTFSTITSAGGGAGAGQSTAGGPGGSGGGGSRGGSSGGTGNTPPVSPPQGNPGGTGSSPVSGGGGGGATAAGSCGVGAGGAGGTSSINGTPTGRGGGGGGGNDTPSSGGAGADGGGSGGKRGGPAGIAGTANTGGGGGGSGVSNNSGAGGSGIVIIRYKFQN